VNVAPRLDRTTLVGVLGGLGFVFAGAALDGGSVRMLFQAAAAVIVFGGTLAAVLVSYPLEDLTLAMRSFRDAIFERMDADETEFTARVTAYAARARRMGVLGLESDIDREPDSFLRTGLAMAVDDVRPQAIRAALETEMSSLAERDELAPRVLESAGGYAPTMGILGAVLGLINVMQHLSTPSRVGPGIAVAFVATVYGVGAANLIFLPLASKLRQRARQAERRRAMTLEAVVAIREAASPRLVEQRLAALRLGAQPERKSAARGRSRTA
jgi:chemotaxis protein MotA